MTLALLSDVKTVLDLTDTSQDAKLQLFINRVSVRIQDYLGYPVQLGSYTSEVYAINNNQLLYLRKAAVQSVTAVSLQGSAVANGTDDDSWQATDEDFLAGRIYRGIGWCGRYFTRDMTYDPVAGARDILVTYTAGWICPGDNGYTEGAAGCLPSTITDACIQAVVERFRANLIGGEGLVSVQEGGSKIMLAQKSAPGGIPEVSDGSGFTEEVKGMLNPYKRFVVL